MFLFCFFVAQDWFAKIIFCPTLALANLSTCSANNLALTIQIYQIIRCINYVHVQTSITAYCNIFKQINDTEKFIKTQSIHNDIMRDMKFNDENKDDKITMNHYKSL